MPKKGFYKEQVLLLRKDKPNINLKEAQKELPGLTESNFYKILRENPLDDSKDSEEDNKIPFQDQKKTINVSSTNDNSFFKNDPEMSFIDDPNEILMSCSMRELNKPDPDVQWARILLTILEKTNRLETKTNEEVMIRRKLVNFSSNRLIELRKKLTSS